MDFECAKNRKNLEDRKMNESNKKERNEKETAVMDFYEPIIRKIDGWIWYMDTKPVGKYSEMPEVFDEHRSTHDLDCILTGGDLNADTIFSLWTPLKSVLYRLAGQEKRIYRALGVREGYTIYKNRDTLQRIKRNIRIVLPKEKPEVKQLIKLFELGQERCNVMILPDHDINMKRGGRPYIDYMPYFLRECFAGGDFASYFEGDADLEKWIRREYLQMFFEEGILAPKRIRDLTGSGDVRVPQVTDLEQYLTNYIRILECRKSKMEAENAGKGKTTDMEEKQSRIGKIYFDMDGVLADFDKGIVQLCGIDRSADCADKETQDDRMWSKVKEVGHFYDKLDPMPGALEMFREIRSKYGEKVEILTGIPKPHRGIDTAAEDKVSWAHRVLDRELILHTIFRQDKKNYVKGQGDILIDDSEKNIEEWNAAGGTGILFQSAEKVLERLKELETC